MKFRNTILFVLIAAGCCFGQPAKDTLISFGSFTLRAPATWKPIRQTGIDSYVGGLTNGVDTLEFDYGRYSFKPKRKDDACRISYRLQAGHVARYAKQIKPGKGITAVYIRHKRLHLVLYGINTRNEAEVLRIMRSVRFTKK